MEAINQMEQQQKKPCFKCITQNIGKIGGGKICHPCNDCMPEWQKKERQEMILNAMEILPKRIDWKRTTFNFHEGKAWCYQKKEKHPEYDREILKGHYCYNCKNELIFKYKDKREYYDPEPFRFHKLLVKVLEKKDDDWKTGRKTHSYYAFCCKCAKQDTSDGTVKKHRFIKKLMGFEMEKCDCASFIEDKKRQATQEIANYNSTIKDCNELMLKIEGLKEKKEHKIYTEEKLTFKERRIGDFIQQLIQYRNDAIENKQEQENYLLLYNEWETKRNQQLEKYDHE